MFFFEIPAAEGNISSGSGFGSAIRESDQIATPNIVVPAVAPVIGNGSYPKRRSVMVAPNSENMDPEQYRHVSTPGEGPGELSLRRLHVFVVDDSALNRKMLMKRFEKEGYSLAEADDGDTAVAYVHERLLKKEPLDVITMDNVLLL